MKKIAALCFVLCFVPLLFGCTTSGVKGRTSLPAPNINTAPQVVIYTDKSFYSQGESIKIVINNGLDKPILYYSQGDKFWGIEYLKDDKWVNPAYEEGGGFQYTESNLGDRCYIMLYEQTPPVELKSQNSISQYWGQKICPFGTGSPSEPKIVRYIAGGSYRFVFDYGFKTSDNDPFRLSESNTIYSNIFTIK